MPKKLYIYEEYTNESEGYRYGGGELPYESWADTDDIGRLFLNLQREYGRCISSVYQETDAPPGHRRIGWVFEKQMEYQDARPWTPKEERYYLGHTWITLYTMTKKGKFKPFELPLR